MNGGEMADPVSPVEVESGGCSFCTAQALAIPAAMGFVVPTPLGEVAIRLCVRHLGTMIAELSEAERQITGVTRPTAPKLTVVRR
jgi:hypothetical protein